MTGLELSDDEVGQHDFVFEKSGECQAGAFVGCVAAKTNKAIPEENRVEGANTSINIVTAPLSSMEQARDGYWVDKLKVGGEETAKKFCRMKHCCCPEVTIYWKTGKGMYGAGAANPYSKKVINCKDYEKDLP